MRSRIASMTHHRIGEGEPHEMLVVDMLAGTHIDEAIREAATLAITKSCVVRFKFNGEYVRINPRAMLEYGMDRVRITE